MSFAGDFKAFVLRGNVVDLAVGVIIGGAFGAIVNSLVNDLVMPPLGQLTKGIDFKEMNWAFDGKTYNTVAAAKAAGVATINYGNFINVTINFLLIAFVIFLIVRYMAKFIPAPPPPGPTPTELLLTEIRDLLKKDSPDLLKKGV
jgi:large conductance mechanosensitive channel